MVIIGVIKGWNIVEVNYMHIDLSIVFFQSIIVMSLLLVYKKIDKYRLKILEMVNNNKWLFFLIGFIEYEIMSFVMVNCRDETDIQMLIWVCITVIGVLVIILLLMFKMLYSQVQMENRMIIHKQQTMEIYYMQLRKNYENIARINHNIKHERAYIYQCIKNGKVAEVLNFLENIVQNVSVQHTWTGNKVIDFLFDIKIEEMKEKNIRFALQCEYTTLPIPENDFCLILGLLLENAVEAAEKCNLGNGWIKIELKNINDIFKLQIKNSCVSVPQKKGGKFITSKENKGIHGWGLINVESIVEKYDGTIKYDSKSDEFGVRIVFWKVCKEEEFKKDL